MMANPKRSGALVLRLIVGLALLAWPRVGFAQGTWSVISLPQWVNSLPHKPGEVFSPTALAVDAAGDLYIADGYPYIRIQKRDAQGNCYENSRPGSVQANRSPAASPPLGAAGR
jgi:hypothetical protein